MKIAHKVALGLLVVGGLNRLLVGALNFDLVAWIFGSMSVLARAVYIIVGICALFVTYAELANCHCKK